jgi:hypothetical protein
MTLLETLFPQINEIWIPLLITLVGVLLFFIGLAIPFIGWRVSALGITVALFGVIWWIIQDKLSELLSNKNILMAIGLGFILLIFAIIVLGKKKK